MRLYALLGSTVLAALVLLAAQGVTASAGLQISSVSGSPNNGVTITVQGQGFGTKATAAPLKWDNFENGTNNANITGWELDSAGPTAVVPHYSNVVTRTNSHMSSRHDFLNGNWNSSLAITGRTFDKVYLDGWVYVDEAPPYSRNHKLYRLYTNQYDQPDLYYNLYCANHGSHLDQDGLTGGKGDAWLTADVTDFARKWVHVQSYFEESGVSVDNGTAMIWIDGVKQADLPNAFRTRETNTHWNALYIGHYLGHDAVGDCPAYGDAFVYWDDVYVDTTQARIEIGDAATYAASRHREIQLPATWSDTSIILTVNQGSFATLNGTYLFVIDSAGNASPGYPLGGATLAPAAPSNLRILP